MARDFGGGMENISATTQIDNMIHDARTELDQTSDGLQSHELAHQWFGDYLTCGTRDAGPRTLRFQSRSGFGRGSVSLGDARGLALFEEQAKKAEARPPIQGLIRNFQEQLKKKLEAKPKRSRD